MPAIAVIIDTETTGFVEPEVIQLACQPLDGGPHDETSEAHKLELRNFKPSKDIEIAAMATHHIIAADLETAEPWLGKWVPPQGTQYLIGHNIDFDWKAIGSPPIKRICTLALARFVFPDLATHKLGALIYHLYPPEVARVLVGNAHNAGCDVDLTKRILWALLGRMSPRPESWEAVWQVSEFARIPTRWWLGKKYGPKDGRPGALIAETRKTDPGWTKWVLNNVTDLDEYQRKALTD